jgi:16S rRNA (cytosine967-C5)-methyltransferase
VNERETAFRILQRIEKQGAFAAPLLSDAGDFVRHLVLGILRWRSRLDADLEVLSRRRSGQIDQPALQLLRIGLFQIAHMNVPAHAAVAETMRVASNVLPRAKPFINAVLRQAARELPDGSGYPLAVRWAHPDWLVERWMKLFGEERTEAILKANQELSYPDLIVNTRRLPVEDAHRVLAARGIRYRPSPLLPNVVRLEESTERLRPEIEEGLFYPMDEGSVAVASLVPTRTRRLLDFTAAPGGKTIVSILRGIQAVSHDVSLRRLMPLRVSGRRITGTPPVVVIGDARQPAFREQCFDSVLIDAPCSATGTIRKNPEIKWRLEREQLREFSVLQREILASALDLGPENAIYATCSLEPEENDSVVSRVLAARSGYERGDLAAIAPPSLRPWIADGVLRLSPEAGTDGFTAAWIRRRYHI